jgi:hypothetical protein
MKWKIGSALRAGFKYSLLASLGSVSCAAGLSPEELQQIEDGESIYGCSLSRLLFNLVGEKGSLRSIVDQEEPFMLALEWFLSLYESLPQDPVAVSAKNLGETNYFVLGLLPRDSRELRCPRPFEVNDPEVTESFPLDKQRQLKTAFIAYNEYFFSPANLVRLKNAADAITEALTSYVFESAVPELFQNFAYQHTRYLTDRLSDDCKSLFPMILRIPDGLQSALAVVSPLTPPFRHLYAFLGELSPLIKIGIQDHSWKFRPHILALFNLMQSSKILCAFLEENPLMTLKECATLAMSGGDIREIRGLIIVYEIIITEFIEYMKNLDNSFFELLSDR